MADRFSRDSARATQATDAADGPGGECGREIRITVHDLANVLATIRLYSESAPEGGRRPSSPGRSRRHRSGSRPRLVAGRAAAGPVPRARLRTVSRGWLLGARQGAAPCDISAVAPTFPRPRTHGQRLSHRESQAIRARHARLPVAHPAIILHGWLDAAALNTAPATRPAGAIRDHGASLPARAQTGHWEPGSRTGTRLGLPVTPFRGTAGS